VQGRWLSAFEDSKGPKLLKEPYLKAVEAVRPSMERQFSISKITGSLLILVAVFLVISSFVTAFVGSRLTEWASWRDPGQIHFLRSVQTTFIAAAIVCLLGGILLAAAGYYHAKDFENQIRRLNDQLYETDVRVRLVEKLTGSFRQCGCGALVLDPKAEFCGICGRRVPTATKV